MSLPAVGPAVTKGLIDSIVGAFLTGNNFRAQQAQAFYNYINNLTDADLNALGYTGTSSSGDVQTLRGIAADNYRFWLVYLGAFYVAPGATAGTGVPTINDATHFGYKFGALVNLTGPGF